MEKEKGDKWKLFEKWVEEKRDLKKVTLLDWYILYGEWLMLQGIKPPIDWYTRFPKALYERWLMLQYIKKGG